MVYLCHNFCHFLSFQFDLKFNGLKEEYEKQTNAKDEKLKIMKKQIAEALTGSSLYVENFIFKPMAKQSTALFMKYIFMY